MKSALLVPILSAMLTVGGAETAHAARPFPAGKVTDTVILYEYALYFTPRPTVSPETALKRLLATKHKAFIRMRQPDPTEAFIITRTIPDVAKNYPPPSTNSMRYAAQGLTKQQAKGLTGSQNVFVMTIGYPSTEHARLYPQALRLTADMARLTGGLIWDEQTRHAFSLTSWEAQRLNTFSDGIADLSEHTTIHAYKHGDYVRAITLGMIKFGLPEIELSGFPWSSAPQAHSLITLVSQHLYEQGGLKIDGVLLADPTTLRHAGVRKHLTGSALENAQLKTSLTLKIGTREEGDPENRIMEIAFTETKDRDKQANIEHALSELWGWKDSTLKVTLSPAVLAASQQARAHFPDIKIHLKSGLEPGEYYLIKAPFETPNNGLEWMWVEVTHWKDSGITGLLRNDPVNIPTLHAGSRVTVKESEILDYVHSKPDGTHSGNTTGALLQKRRQKATLP